VKVVSLSNAGDWDTLKQTIAATTVAPVLETLLAAFQTAGAASYVLEDTYIDRDFSAAYAAFYATLFKPYLKHCRRIHFFQSDIPQLVAGLPSEEKALAVEGEQERYLGFVTLRPVAHAPVGMAIMSARHLFADAATSISVQGEYTVHVLGAELSVKGVPVTQQDTRVGACAQAAIWTVGRHLHARHKAPWYSVADITELALNPIDSTLSQSLPAGSAFLTVDNMVRALRAMGRHPVVHVKPEKSAWATSPVELAYRYLDSGIPVIMGLNANNATIGHAVVLVGQQISGIEPGSLPTKPTLAEGVTHFIVCDDQRGPYCRLPAKESDRTPDYQWTVETDCQYLIVPLPSKVFMPGDIADAVARGYFKEILSKRAAILNQNLKPIDPTKIDAQFEIEAASDQTVSRTYLTYGWRYRSRAVRNAVPEDLKAELLDQTLPRYVWVTEFSRPNESYSVDPCVPRVKAHIVLDATGSNLWESELVIEVPGLSLAWHYSPGQPYPGQAVAAFGTEATHQYWPKVRGWSDFSFCALPPKA
jgi:hypothetical protein